MPYITVGTENSASIDLYYEDHGTGQPVVLIAGFPFGGSTWEKQVGELLPAGFRVITYDRRGFGKSSQPAEGYDYDTFAADLDTILTELELQDIILVGHSMGTGEVIRYLGTYGSERVNRAVVMAPLAPFLLKTADNPEGVDQSLFDGFKQAVVADRFKYLTSFVTAFFNFDENKGKRVSEEAFRGHWNIGAGASAVATLHSIDAWLTDFRPDLPRIDVPVLIIQGDKDNVLPYPATGQRLHPMLPGSELVTLKGAPHGIPWTHAKESNQAIMNFLAKVPAMSGKR
ncbi:alpha/beta hydrolase [Plantactinospora sp. S1510]|uniref:Alpha/beta hydrolase n=1 Tax=Plantactinospora alkalitolerans TaxID=2789879 RepID=A0ABS0GUP7_9ACTN|nr:alpha/beta hydrolase [Plantactinospora alkalitolerans]MBF9129937.1 alpha/beta hydrolase [Plantactinospora alkalitolerans]